MNRERFVRVDGKQLSEALQLCAFVVERRNTYPILGMVKVEHADGALEVSATDLDIELSIALKPDDGAGDWAVCLPTHPFANIAALAGTGGVLISPKDEPTTKPEKDPMHAEVSLDQGDLFQEVAYTLEGLSVASFPEIKGTRGDLIEAFGNGRLGELLRRVSWAMSFEETRYYLNGVNWQVGGPLGRRFAATDGHRLALCSYDRGDTQGLPVNRILPIKLVKLIERMIPPDMNCFGVRVDDRPDPNRLEIEAGRATIRAKLIDGQFPDIDRVIPKASNHVARFELPADRLSGALDRALAVAVGSRSARTIQFSKDDSGMIAVVRAAADYGAAKIVTPFPWPEGGVEFGVNGRYLREVLKSCAGPLRLMQVDAMAPLTILDEDETMLRLLMPMRVRV